MEIREYTVTNKNTGVETEIIEHKHNEFYVRNKTTGKEYSVARDLKSLNYEYEITNKPLPEKKPELLKNQ